MKFKKLIFLFAVVVISGMAITFHPNFSFYAEAQNLQISAATADQDQDGIPDSSDNCPEDVNRDQKDSDGNGVGDACEITKARVESTETLTDFDSDGVSDEKDNCPAVSNPRQIDSDDNGIGDACETKLESIPVETDSDDDQYYVDDAEAAFFRTNF